MTDTSGIEYTTQHDQKPSHRKVSAAVTVANEHAIVARKVYDDYITEMLDNGITGIDWTEAEYLAKKANDAEDALDQARHEALNECSCTPDSDACPVCVADNKERYGDSIPFSGTQEGGE